MTGEQDQEQEPVITLTCEQCGAEYDPENESAADHADDCPIRHAYVESGRWNAETGGESA